jgi:hypothetical protein
LVADLGAFAGRGGVRGGIGIAGFVGLHRPASELEAGERDRDTLRYR